MKSDPITYMMDLAKQEPIHADIKQPCNFVRGCQNYIWYEMFPQGNRFGFRFASGSAISLGMCLILGSYLSDKSLNEIQKVKFNDLREFTRHLPMDRQRGVQAVLNRILQQTKLIDTNNI